MAIVSAVRKGVIETLQSAQTSGNGTVFAVPPDILSHAFYLTASNATVTTGAVQCETSDDPNFAGTWAAVGAATTLVQNAKLIISFAGVLSFIRARISTAVTGGATCTVTYQGNPSK